jgi:predicted nuclease of restriction endonuclease-like (RecB) superfamily
MIIDELGQRVVGQLEMPEIFGRVPWGQHIDIISRCETLEEALFYIQQVVDRGWSRPTLNANIDKHLYQSQGAAITNFANTLADTQSQPSFPTCCSITYPSTDM